MSSAGGTAWAYAVCNLINGNCKMTWQESNRAQKVFWPTEMIGEVLLWCHTIHVLGNVWAGQRHAPVTVRLRLLEQ